MLRFGSRDVTRHKCVCTSKPPKMVDPSSSTDSSCPVSDLSDFEGTIGKDIVENEVFKMKCAD